MCSRTMGCSVVPNSMWVLALMPSWSRCLLDASLTPWFILAGSEDVLGNEFNLDCAVPVSAPSGTEIDYVCSLCRDAVMLMRPCGFTLRFFAWVLPCFLLRAFRWCSLVFC